MGMAGEYGTALKQLGTDLEARIAALCACVCVAGADASAVFR
jgi:hypothetical protein